MTLSNLSTNVVTIAPKTVIAELQPVDIEEVGINSEQVNVDSNNTGVLNKVKIDSELSDQQHCGLMCVLKKHEDIFSKGDTDIGKCKVAKHRIELTKFPLKKSTGEFPLA